MQDIVVTPRVTIPGGEVAIAFARSGGPGGQNVNKVASKVELRWNPATSIALSADDRAWLLERLRRRLTSDGTLIVTSSATRDQLKNRNDATSKLALIAPSPGARPGRRERPAGGGSPRSATTPRSSAAAACGTTDGTTCAVAAVRGPLPDAPCDGSC
jgi:ribosome-associated protein